jgi:hypothetical protein
MKKRRAVRIDAFKAMHAAEREERLRRQGKLRLPRKVSRIIEGAKREIAIERTASILATYNLSPFQYEAASRTGIRVELVLDGFGWESSDAEAASIVSAALDRIGARRPTWAQGQREYTVPAEFCSWCHSPLDEELLNDKRHVGYCTEICARAALRWRETEGDRRNAAAVRAAYDVIARLRHEPRTCLRCGRRFLPVKDGQEHCSIDCARGTRDDRICEACGKRFHPRREDQRYCSTACGHAHLKAAPDATCWQCGKRFKERHGARFCSTPCAEAYRRRPRIPKVCRWCEKPFLAQSEKAETCCAACKNATGRVRRGAVRKMSIRAFDVAFDVQLPPPKLPITPDAFDYVMSANRPAPPALYR